MSVTVLPPWQVLCYQVSGYEANMLVSPRYLGQFHVAEVLQHHSLGKVQVLE